MLLLEDKYQYIKDEIRFPSEFGVDEEDDYCSFFDDLPYNVSMKYDVRNGCTKGIFIADSAYVLKVPFNGMWKWNNWDDDLEEPIDCEEPYFEEFFGATNPDNDWDYCEMELNFYEDMVDRGLQMFFAETKYYGESKDGTPLYLQEKCISEEDLYGFDEDDDEYKMTRSSEDSRQKYETLRKNREICCFNPNWLGKCIDCYGEELVEQLIDLYTHNNQLRGDMHKGNYGYRRSDGSPVMIDYSNFNH